MTNWRLLFLAKLAEILMGNRGSFVMRNVIVPFTRQMLKANEMKVLNENSCQNKNR